MTQGDPDSISSTPTPWAPPDSSAPQEPVPTLSARIELNGPQQAAAGALGFGALVAGVFAVFQTDNEAGSTALLVVGLLLMIITLAKQVPTSLKAGDNEMAFQAGEEVGAARKAAEVVAAASEAAEAEGAGPAEVAAAVREAAVAPSHSTVEHAATEWLRSRMYTRFLEQVGNDPALLTMFRLYAGGATQMGAADQAGVPRPVAVRKLLEYRDVLTKGTVPPRAETLRDMAARDFGVDVE